MGKTLDQTHQDFIRSTKKANDKVDALPPSSTSGIPGQVIMGGWVSTPAGYLPCDGAAYSRVGYPALFAAIGTRYGAGDGSTTFNVPQMADTFPSGKSAGSVPGTRSGAKTHTHGLGSAFAAFDLDPSHSYAYRITVPAWAVSNEGDTAWRGPGASTSRSSGVALGGLPDQASSIPPTVSFTFVIKF